MDIDFSGLIRIEVNTQEIKDLEVKLSPSESNRVLSTAMEVAAQVAVERFQEITKNWSNVPEFGIRKKQYSFSQVSFEIDTNSEEFKWVDRGTRPHNIEPSQSQYKQLWYGKTVESLRPFYQITRKVVPWKSTKKGQVGSFGKGYLRLKLGPPKTKSPVSYGRSFTMAQEMWIPTKSSFEKRTFAVSHGASMGGEHDYGSGIRWVRRVHHPGAAPRNFSGQIGAEIQQDLVPKAVLAAIQAILSKRGKSMSRAEMKQLISRTSPLHRWGREVLTIPTYEVFGGELYPKLVPAAEYIPAGKGKY